MGGAQPLDTSTQESGSSSSVEESSGDETTGEQKDKRSAAVKVMHVLLFLL